MSNKPTIEQSISEYFERTTKAVTTLYSHDLPGHALVIIYSSIDTFGLLDAPADINSATGDLFKKWCNKYFFPNSTLTVNDADLWSARCAVLHSHMSASDLSRAGKARELAYFSGDEKSEKFREFTRITNSMNNGKFCAVNYEELIRSLGAAMIAFIPVLNKKCQEDSRVANRLKNVIRTYEFG